MRRLVVQIEERTYERLRRRAFDRQVSMAAVVRQVLNDSLAVKPDPVNNPRKLSFIGIGDSGRGDIGRRHDEELAEILYEEHVTNRGRTHK